MDGRIKFLILPSSDIFLIQKCVSECTNEQKNVFFHFLMKFATSLFFSGKDVLPLTQRRCGVSVYSCETVALLLSVSDCRKKVGQKHLVGSVQHKT